MITKYLNYFIVLLAFAMGGAVGYKAAAAANAQTIKLLTPTIKSAIMQETTKIENHYKTEIEKIKTHKGGLVEWETKPQTETQVEQLKIEPKKTLNHIISKPRARRHSR